MSVIDEVRKDREDLARVLKRHTGIRRIVEDLYPDKAHFIFELLQNAEDRGATEVSFSLTSEKLRFEHNGETFRPQDIYAITDIGEGTKPDDDDKIGRFGVGFKAVFAYTETPHIWSPTFSFSISDLVLPSVLSSADDIRSNTRFEFPFDNPKKACREAFQEIKSGLDELAENTLLFLPNIESIKWSIGDAFGGEILCIEHTKFHVEVMKQVNGQTTTSAHFLKFDQVVTGLEKQRAAIAFAMDFLPNVQKLTVAKPLAQQLKIVPVPGQVAVFFPANKESSGLRFHLHAPFVPELSRASIKETPANDPLFNQLATLAASSLNEIRDLGLLTTEFLGVLPNPQDQLGKPYECIREAIIEAMDNEPLTPTHSRRHAPARTLYQAKASLKELLSAEDLELLLEANVEEPQWAANRALQGTNAERFMNSLAIQDWDIEAFIGCIDEKVREESWHEPDMTFLGWLSKKGVEWHQQFYALLAKEAQDEIYRLKSCSIVRLVDGNYETGENCHFSDDRGLKAGSIKYVDPAVYTTGKSKAQQESALKFLREVGVTDVVERQFVAAILKSRYTSDNQASNQRKYPSDIRRFIKLLDEDPSCASLFSRYLLFMASDNRWHKPADIYLDAPHLDTGLGEYFALAGVSNKLLPLADFYRSLPIDTAKITRFAEKLGCTTTMKPVQIYCSKNPSWNYLSSAPGERNTNPINRDYSFNHFHQLERFPRELNRLGFPNRRKSDS